MPLDYDPQNQSGGKRSGDSRIDFHEYPPTREDLDKRKYVGLGQEVSKNKEDSQIRSSFLTPQ